MMDQAEAPAVRATSSSSADCLVCCENVMNVEMPMAHGAIVHRLQREPVPAVAFQPAAASLGPGTQASAPVSVPPAVGFELTALTPLATHAGEERPRLATHMRFQEQILTCLAGKQLQFAFRMHSRTKGYCRARTPASNGTVQLMGWTSAYNFTQQ
ncbi:hypothetical protein WJX84_005370 [Apatococcus fuscideae]|uniref:Uncharacterized protein n=1 Tax=Apatococcus fuscideae TaxID=2026836 RepID=A0AAW1TF08_9CHLO